jgi:hypothetical protein
VNGVSARWFVSAHKLALAAATVVSGIAQPPKPMPAGL